MTALRRLRRHVAAREHIKNDRQENRRRFSHESTEESASDGANRLETVKMPAPGGREPDYDKLAYYKGYFYGSAAEYPGLNVGPDR